MPVPALPDLIAHPKRIGMYADGKLQYSVPLPVQGWPPIPVQFPVGSVLSDVEAEMERRRVAFNAHRALAEILPATWLNVGYVADAKGITAYYQVKPGGFEYAPPLVWSNWPATPATYTPPNP